MQKWMTATKQFTRDYCVAIAMINSSTGFRFLLSAIFVIQSMPCPYEVCGSFADAIAFVDKQADKRGLKHPAAKSPWPDVP